MAVKRKKRAPYNASPGVQYLEKGLLHQPIEERLVAAAQKIHDKESQSMAHPDDGLLRRHQIPALLNFADYLMDLATSPDNSGVSPFCRIVLPHRPASSNRENRYRCKDN
jgi:hypothetical protein